MVFFDVHLNILFLKKVQTDTNPLRPFLLSTMLQLKVCNNNKNTCPCGLCLKTTGGSACYQCSPQVKNMFRTNAEAAFTPNRRKPAGLCGDCAAEISYN